MLIDQIRELMQLWRDGDQSKVNGYLDERVLRRNALFAQILQALIELAGAGSEERSVLEALDPQEVWILEKEADGFSTVRRASDDPLVKNLVEEELPLGGLWYSGYLDAR